jgi:O-methyltransferase
LLHLADSVPGDTAECGTFSGASSRIICQANKYATCQGKRHHVFDSFERFPKPERVDGLHETKEDSAYGVEHVQEKVCEFDLTDYYSGWIPAKFPDVKELQFSFVHIDIDRHQPAGDSIAFFYPRMTDGGVILVGDCGITSRQGVTEAVDEFLSDKPERMSRLSGGGGFLLKGTRTQSARSAFAEV